MNELTSFHPEWIGLLRSSSGEGLTFDCPVCGPSHRLAVYFLNPTDGKESAPWQSPKWHVIGNKFENLTIEPSIQYPCFHGWIEYGQVIDVSESTMVVNLQTPQGMKKVAFSPRQVEQFNFLRNQKLPA